MGRDMYGGICWKLMHTDVCTQYCEACLNSTTVARKPYEYLLNQGTCASADGSGSRDMEPWLDGTLGLAKSAPTWHAHALADAAQYSLSFYMSEGIHVQAYIYIYTCRYTVVCITAQLKAAWHFQANVCQT